MAESFLDAAQRHFGDGEALQRATRLDGAGHHFGIAGECAVKAVCVEESNQRPQKHFSEVASADLRQHAVPNLSGRKGQRMLAELPTLFLGWSVHDRYSATGHTSGPQLEQWRADAVRALNLMQGL
jgi:hypothetical protein